MINGLEGIPGSGKSYEAAVQHVLPSLQKGRKVITNLPLLVEVFAAIDPAYRDLIELRTRARPIRGTWDANRVDEQGNGNAFELFEDRHTVEPAVSVTAFGHVWDYWSEWKHPDTGQGPLFVIDECHVPLPTRGTDTQVIEWFKLHRHFNSDVLLCTQSFRDIDQPVARLIAMLIKVRKADFLGKADYYVRKVHAGYRGAVISTEQRKYEAQYFKLYRSHTQGNSVSESMAQDVKPFLVKFRRASWVVLAAGVVFTVMSVYKAVQPVKPLPVPVARPAVQPVPIPPATVAPSSQPVSSTPLTTATHVQGVPMAQVDPTPPPKPSGPPEPYGSKGLHLTGFAKMGEKSMYTFAVSQNGLIVVAVTDSDLQRTGYRWEPTTECTGTLYWHDTPRVVTCDAPQIGMALTGTGPRSNTQQGAQQPMGVPRS